MSCRWCTDMRVKRPVALDIFRTEFPPLNPVFPDMADCHSSGARLSAGLKYFASNWTIYLY